MRKGACYLAWLFLGCSQPAEKGSAPSADAPQRPIAAMSLEAGREAHRQAEVRRHLRFLEAIDPGCTLRWTAAAAPQEQIDAGEVSLARLREVGRTLFEHDYTFAEGLGNAATPKPGQSRSPFRRVHQRRFGGPETTTCTSCHWRGGPAGAGGLQDNSFLYGDGDRIQSADARNPPPLQGVGVAQALGEEMTAELQAIRADLLLRASRERRRVESPLVARGVAFGKLAVEADGRVDASAVEGVDADLVVKPFGWKGTFASLRDFVTESLQVHFGIQSEDLVHRHRDRPDPELAGAGRDPDDPDGDGVKRELTEGQLTALVTLLALEELPVVRPPETLHDMTPVAPNVPAPTASVYLDEWARGRQLFGEVGCARCHVPMLVLKDPVYRTRSRLTGGVLEIDLSREIGGLRHDARLGGYPVWLFSDLKRHDLGTRNAAKHIDHGVAPRQYLTRRLWGLAASAPYLYDGSAPWLDQAIDAHQGEASESHAAYTALGREDKGALRVFLLSLDREIAVMVP